MNISDDSLKFIQQHQNKSLTELALLLSKKTELNKDFILAQINGIQKAKNKLPQFYSTPNIIYPIKLSLEQCSSEKTGVYKSEIINGEKLLDLTGGFGVDSYYFSKTFTQVTYLEQNKSLHNIVKQNIKLLGAKNIKLFNSTAEDFIATTTQKFDVIYIDPSRRNQNQRVFKLDECTPNIIELTSSLFKISNKILIKTAPLLDIKQTIKDLKFVTKIWVIAVDNDCKEVLYLLENEKIVEPQISTINLTKENQEFEFNFKQEETANTELSEPENFLYEPNSSILKAGAFNSLCKSFNIKKLGQHTHLYISKTLIDDFPGRTFKIENVLSYNTKEFRKLNIQKANVSCRNFKDNVEQIKKKLKIKDGGKNYLFATNDKNNKPILIVCVK
ncbi:MAG: RsmD family RNA methyltransferase [Flavobacteriales bacterium]|nr:RsmD family RNA methyltransferase [Flavobacteriales bacterium]